jgi:hypothetical protein
MAARRWQLRRASLYHTPVTLWCHIVIGVAGAVTSFAGRGIANVTLTAAGRYQITLSDAYRGLLACHVMMECAANNVDIYGQLEGEAVNTAGGGIVDIRTKTGAVSTAPANGDDIWVTLDLMNSSVDAVI